MPWCLGYCEQDRKVSLGRLGLVSFQSRGDDYGGQALPHFLTLGLTCYWEKQAIESYFLLTLCHLRMCRFGGQLLLPCLSQELSSGLSASAAHVFYP